MNGMPEPGRFTIHVAGTARDCGPGLLQRLVRTEDALRAVTNGSLYFHLFENDSKDSTREEVVGFGSTRPYASIHFADGLAARVSRREERLAYCRNQLLDSIAKVESPPDQTSIYLPVDLDLDIDWSALTEPLRDAIALVQSGALDGVFPVSGPHFYDIHALRAGRWNSKDPWAAVARAEAHRLLQRIPRWVIRGVLVHAKQVPLERLRTRGRVVPVESAFGGFGIYLLDRVRGREYRSTVEDRCEHVEFNRGLKVALLTDLTLNAPLEHLGRTLFHSRFQRGLIKLGRSLHPLG